MPTHLCLVNVASRLVTEHPILMFLSFILFVAFLGLMAVAVLHNLYLSRAEIKRSKYAAEVQSYLSELISSTIDSSTLRLETQVALNSQPELKKKLLFDPLARAMLRSEIKTLHNSLEGLSAKTLRTTYLSLGFLEECIAQLRNGDWVQRAEAINEFAEMEIYTVKDELKPFLVSPQSELRILAQTFYAKISEEPLAFLKDYPYALSKWDKIELINVLRKRKMDKFPGLRELFGSENETVRSFALLMTTELQLTSYYSALIPALEDAQDEVRLQAIKQIKKWHHPAALSAVEALDLNTKSNKEKKLITQSVEHLKQKIVGDNLSELLLKSGIKLKP